MTTAAEEVISSGCAIAEELDMVDKQKMADDGVKFVSLPDADVAILDEKLASIGQRWSSELDDRGLAGTEILNAFRDALKEQAGSN